MQKGDEKILAEASKETVATEAQYHDSTYKNYTKPKKEQFCKEKKNEDETGSDKLFEKIEKVVDYFF